MNIYKYDRDTKEELKIASESEKLLNELLDYLEKRNVKALFVVSPYQQIKREKMQFNYIAKIVKSRNQDFLDANDYIDQIKLDFTYDFYNGSHVNIYGAEKYTKFLSEYLIKKYNLPDRRGDKLYDEDFNNLIPKWNQNVEETKKYIEKIKPQHYAYFGKTKDPFADLKKNKFDISNETVRSTKSEKKESGKNQNKGRSL